MQPISPDPRSFKKRLAADNSAGLALDATYTRYYPLAYEFYRSRTGSGRDLKSLADTEAIPGKEKSEAGAVRSVEALIRGSGIAVSR